VRGGRRSQDRARRDRRGHGDERPSWCEHSWSIPHSVVRGAVLRYQTEHCSVSNRAYPCELMHDRTPTGCSTWRATWWGRKARTRHSETSLVVPVSAKARCTDTSPRARHCCATGFDTLRERADELEREEPESDTLRMWLRDFVRDAYTYRDVSARARKIEGAACHTQSCSRHRAAAGSGRDRLSRHLNDWKVLDGNSRSARFNRDPLDCESEPRR
jgi:hypothetical protein